MIFNEIRPDDPLRELKEEINRQHEAAMKETLCWREENPKEFEEWFSGVKQANKDAVIEGFLDGWWDLDDNGNMIAPPIVIDSAELPEGALMAHVIAKAGLFPSVTQARKNGWDKPLTKGVFTVTKKKIRIKVI